MKPDQLSQTAAFIAIKFYGLTLSEPYRSLFDEPTIRFYDRMVAGLPSPLNKYHSWLQKKWIRKFFIFSEELLLPGDLMHILMRKYCISKIMEELISKGYDQLIVLGAGFDHLATKYSARGMPSFEIDVPRMAHLKQNFANVYSYDNNKLNICSAYFSRDSFLNILTGIAGIDSQRKTIIVAEGFFDYLVPGETQAILEEMTAFFDNTVTLISTAFSLNELSRFRALVFKAGVRIVGEQLKLHYSLAEFSRVLAENGFTIHESISADFMKRKILNPRDIGLPVLPGFYLLKAGYG